MAVLGNVNKEGRQPPPERSSAATEDRLRRPNGNRISLLVVDDEQSLARLWATELAHVVEATLAGSLAEARSKLSSRTFDAVLLDLNLPDGNGTELLKEISARDEETAVIILTGNADLNSAIQAVRYGAYDYLIKPCRVVEIEQHIERIAQQRRLRDENVALKQTLAPHRVQADLVGASPQIIEVRRLVGRVAPTNTSVLLTGETGTGKEVTARMIHQFSQRRDGAFIPVNCAALPKELAESELFGHRKGSFTGADRDHRGLVLAASGGTLFLDEIGDLPLDTQAKFLRLLESAEARRVGDTEAYRTDVRIVAATNRDLKRDVTDTRFRQDLFYRLTTFELRLPPLREIPSDIPLIAAHMLHITTVTGCKVTGFQPEAMAALQQYGWPGNVRELRNVIERAMILCEDELIGPEHLNLPSTSETTASMPAIGIQTTIADVEWRMIQDALKRHQGNKTAAARALGISLRTLYNKLDARAGGVRAEDDAE